MPGLMIAHPTSNSLRCELRAEVVARDSLTVRDRDGMYELLESYFEDTSFAQFERDLFEKDSVILLRAEDQSIAGFSTLMSSRATVEGRRVVGFFSGDTIIGREYWGSSLLGRAWLQTVFSAADRLPAGELAYWFLICSGYKTWRYLPVFFRNYLPHPASADRGFEDDVLRTLATRKFGPAYDHAKGIIRFNHANPLRAGVAEITGQRLRDPMVQFFVRANPGHQQGDELACLARISRSNLTRAGLRLLDAGADL